MGAGSYYWAVVRRGAADTRRHATKVALGTGAILFVTGAIIGCWWRQCDAYSIVTGLGAVALYVFGAFVVHLALAPVRMHSEAAEAIPPSRPAPLVVRFVKSKVLMRLPLADSWHFRAYQVADGVELEWSVDSQRLDVMSIPPSARCSALMPAGYGVPGRATIKVEKAVCCFPRDFGDVTPTTGSIEVRWLAKRGDVGQPLPPLHVIRNEPPPIGWTPPDQEAEIECARLAIEIEVTRGDELI